MNGWYALAERQYGVVTRAQLRMFVTDRQIDTLLARQLTPLYRRVFRVAGSYPSARQRAMAAVLYCGDGALLSHTTAAELLRYPAPHDERFHLAVPPCVKRSSEGLVLHRTTTLQRQDRYVVDGLPCTSPARTIIDLAGQLDGETLEHVFESARRMGLATKLAIERRIGDDRAPAALRDLLKLVDARPARLLRKRRALHARRVAGRLRVAPCGRAEPRTAQRGSHGYCNRLAWKRDSSRIAAIEQAGWRLMHVTWEDVTDRQTQTIERVRRLAA